LLTAEMAYVTLHHVLKVGL